MFPAGEMWSVVMLSPSIASTRALRMSVMGSGVFFMPAKYGGCFTYVEEASHLNSEPVGTTSARHASSPL